MPRTICFDFVVRGADSFAFLVRLDMEGVCASSGSACSAGSLEPSHVIKALVKLEWANSLVRFSLGRDSTREEVDFVGKLLPGLSNAHNSENKVRNACEWTGDLVKNSDKDDFIFLPAGETGFLFFTKPSGSLDIQGCLPYSQPLIIRDL
jgi:hypothetical protein